MARCQGNAQDKLLHGAGHDPAADTEQTTD